ncbi:hypothetical protein ACA910_004613 [Epithemia clementina (nom. ined.)]
MYTRATNQHGSVSLIEAEALLHRFKQTEGMTNSDYLEKTKSLVEVYEYLGGEPGCGSNQLQEFAEAGEDITDANTLAKVKARACDEYLAVMLLMKSDTQCYGSLVDDLVNQYTHGVDHAFPTTLNKTYDVLVNYRSANTRGGQHSRGHKDGMAYAPVDCESIKGCGGGGRCNGRGRGRGG